MKKKNNNKNNVFIQYNIIIMYCIYVLYTKVISTIINKGNTRETMNNYIKINHMYTD